MSSGQPLARHSGLRILKGGTLYFVRVFAAGFVLGIIRTIWIAPHFGTRYAELMEAPVMLVGGLPSAWSPLASCCLRNLQSSFGSEGLRSLSILQIATRLQERCMS